MRVLNFELRILCAVVFVVCSVLVTGCNDKPTDIAGDLTPGIDTLYASSSLDSGISLTATTTTKRVPILNSTYALFGKTTDSEARLFIEFINYPTIGAASDFEVVQSDLQMIPQTYRFGDTNNRTVGIVAYDLKREWTLSATWDSIWAPDGSTSYYSTTDAPVCTHSVTLTATDSIINVPFSTDATKRWLVLGADSTTSNQLFGIVMLPTVTGSITQFRNLNGTAQTMRLRVVYKHKDSTTNDTTYLTSATSNFVDTPVPAADELVVQGARIHSSAFAIDLAKLPRNAMILGAKFRVTADKSASILGTSGIDEIMSLTFTPADGTSAIEYFTRVDTDGNYLFLDISYVIQAMIREGSKGALVIAPTDVYEIWRMNRIRIHNSLSDPAVRPRLSLIYTVPTILK
ncbi:MAG: hypothetical protein SGJ05_10535 [bacterium]|nr:hypothetical protein [bacterium]